MKIDDYKNAIDAIPKSKSLAEKAKPSAIKAEKPVRAGRIRMAVCFCSIALCAAAVVATVWHNVNLLNPDDGMAQSLLSTTAPNTEAAPPTTTTAPQLVASEYIRICDVIYANGITEADVPENTEFMLCGIVSSSETENGVLYSVGEINVTAGLEKYIGCEVYIGNNADYVYINKDGNRVYFALYSSAEIIESVDEVITDTAIEITLDAYIYRLTDKNNVQCIPLYGMEMQQLTALEESFTKSDENSSDYTYILITQSDSGMKYTFFNSDSFKGADTNYGNKLIEDYWNNSTSAYTTPYYSLYEIMSEDYEIEPLEDYIEAIEIYRADSDKVSRVMITDQAEINEIVRNKANYETQEYSDGEPYAYIMSLRYIDAVSGDYYFENTYFGNDIFISGVDYYGNAQIEKLFNSKTAYECGERDYNLAIQKTSDVSIWTFTDYYYDMYLIKQYLDAFMLGNTIKMAGLAGASSLDCYEALKGVKLDGYAIIGEPNERGGYTVELYITESDNKRFPVGKSEWEALGTDGTVSSVSMFCPVDETESFEPQETDAESFCITFSNWLNIFDTCTDFTSYIQDGEYSHVLLHLLTDICNEDGKIDYDSAVQLLSARYGLTYPQLKESVFYDAEEIVLNMCSGHGGRWQFYKDLSTTENEDGTLTVSVSYYADACKLIVARTIEYQLMPLDNSYKFRLMSMECVYDSGYHVLGGSI